MVVFHFGFCWVGCREVLLVLSFFVFYVGDGDNWGAVCFGLCVCVEVSKMGAVVWSGGGGNFHMLRTKEKIEYKSKIC